jgi:hypothetical protein
MNNGFVIWTSSFFVAAVLIRFSDNWCRLLSQLEIEFDTTVTTRK